MDRRELLGMFGTLGVAAFAAPSFAQPGATAPTPGWDAAQGQFTLPPLPYDFKALEPHIDARTMEVHHDKHHAAYVAGANKALAELASIRDGGDAGLIKHWSRELSFHLSGHINHALFWQMMAPTGKGGGGAPDGPLADAILRDFGAHEKFVAHFKAAAAQVEGGGWAWLVREPLSGKLLIIQQEKQQDMMPTGVTPLLGIDVWEHAYYLKYENKRAAYIDAWMNVVNWPFVQGLFASSPTTTSK